jgi:hypothetical protein
MRVKRVLFLTTLLLVLTALVLGVANYFGILKLPAFFQKPNNNQTPKSVFNVPNTNIPQTSESFSPPPTTQDLLKNIKQNYYGNFDSYKDGKLTIKLKAIGTLQTFVVADTSFVKCFNRYLEKNGTKSEAIDMGLDYSSANPITIETILAGMLYGNNGAKSYLATVPKDSPIKLNALFLDKPQPYTAGYISVYQEDCSKFMEVFDSASRQ